jgi:hypothetical protein
MRGVVVRIGAGKKADPHRYYVPGGPKCDSGKPTPYTPSLPGSNLAVSSNSDDPLLKRAVQVFGSEVVEVRPALTKERPL